MHTGILFLIVIYTFGRVQVNSLDYCSESDLIEDTVYLWENLFKKINAIMSETSELKSKIANISEDMEEIKLRQKQQESTADKILLKLEAMENKYEESQQKANLEITNLNDIIKNQITDLENGLRKQEKSAEENYQKKMDNLFKVLASKQEEHTHYLRFLTDQYLSNNNEWLTILRRQDGSVDFNRNWTEYKMGFGNPNGEFFIGLEKLHKLTTDGAPKELLIILQDFENEIRIAKYDHFQIGNESEKYNLKKLERYSGNATDSLYYLKDMKFSTYDQDNDKLDTNCAEEYKGGWWYKGCYSSNLCGEYQTVETKSGVAWNLWKGARTSLKYAEMKIRSYKNNK